MAVLVNDERARRCGDEETTKHAVADNEHNTQ